MIKSLSPYYLSIPFVSPLTGAISTAYKLNIFVWNGLKTAVPVAPVYSFSKNNPTASTGNDKINISRLVNDYIDFMPAVGTATGLYDGENQRWCKTSIEYTTANILDTDVEQLSTTTLVLKGFGYGMQGENAQPPANKILLNGTEFKVNRTGFFNIPIILDMTIIDRLEALEAQNIATALITAVFIPDGAMIAWNKPANTIPTGWAEVVDFRGKTLVGKDTSGIFDTLGANVGSNDAVVVAHTHIQTAAASQAGALSSIVGVANGSATTNTDISTASTGVSGTDKNIQASRIVHFIEYIG